VGGGQKVLSRPSADSSLLSAAGKNRLFWQCCPGRAFGRQQLQLKRTTDCARQNRQQIKPHFQTVCWLQIYFISKLLTQGSKRCLNHCQTLVNSPQAVPSGHHCPNSRDELSQYVVTVGPAWGVIRQLLSIILQWDDYT
jgi:hypothetical protein